MPSPPTRSPAARPDVLVIPELGSAPSPQEAADRRTGGWRVRWDPWSGWVIRGASVLLGLLAAAGIVYPIAHGYLTAAITHRLVDLEVYRQGGQSVLLGRPLYGHLTPPPQNLPFTYPPFAALLSVPLSFLSFWGDGIAWTVGELACTVALTWFGFRPLLRRFGAWAPLALGVLVGLMQWMLPLRDEIRFGQVDELMAVLCVLDCVVRHPRWPRGVLIGLAMAIKLTPGVFIPYLWFTGRRKAAAVAAATFAAVTAVTALLLPGDSWSYWTRDVWSPGRTGPNAGTSNQSLRGMLLRLQLGHTLDTLLWVVLVAVVAYLGYRRARRASATGNEVAGVAIVGMLAVLLSPVAWIHHLAWLPLAVGAIVYDGRNPRRLLAAAAVFFFFWAQLPWYGAPLLHHHQVPWLVSQLIRDAFGLGALALALFLPWRRLPTVPRPAPPTTLALEPLGRAN